MPSCTKCRARTPRSDDVMTCPACGHTFLTTSFKIADARERIDFFKSELVRQAITALCDAMDGHSGYALMELDDDAYANEGADGSYELYVNGQLVGEYDNFCHAKGVYHEAEGIRSLVKVIRAD